MECRELRVVSPGTTYNEHFTHSVAPNIFAEVEDSDRSVN